MNTIPMPKLSRQVCQLCLHRILNGLQLIKEGKRDEGIAYLDTLTKHIIFWQDNWEDEKEEKKENTDNEAW